MTYDLYAQRSKAQPKMDNHGLKLMDSGYSVIKSSTSKDVYISYCAIVKNESHTKTIENPAIQVIARDADGRILGTNKADNGYLGPGDKAAIQSGLFVGTSIPHSVDIEVSRPKYITDKVAKASDFKIYKMREVKSKTGNDMIKGILAYKGDLTIPEVKVTAVYKKGKKIVFADDTDVTDIDNQLDTYFVIDPTSSDIPKHDTIDFYIQQQKLSE